MADLKLLSDPDPPDRAADWAVRGGIALLFLAAGWEKFSNEPGSHWVTMFDQIGFGVWFRYFTGVVEILAAALLLIPRTAQWGIVVAACTMAGAAALLWLRLGRASDGIFPGLILVALVFFALFRTRK